MIESASMMAPLSPHDRSIKRASREYAAKEVFLTRREL